MKIGDNVKVTHYAGIEYGTLESINYKSGKALVAFSADSFNFKGKVVQVNNLCGFNISQIEATNG
jgi:hypothetical protein